MFKGGEREDEISIEEARDNGSERTMPSASVRSGRLDCRRTSESRRGKGAVVGEEGGVEWLGVEEGSAVGCSFKQPHPKFWPEIALAFCRRL
jgi:hypothetical protein